MPTIRCLLSVPTIRCLLDVHNQMPTIRCKLSKALWDANYQIPTIRCLLSDAYYHITTIRCQISDAYYHMSIIRWLLPDTYYKMPTIRCILSNAYYHANYFTEVWLSCSDVIQGLLPKPYFPIWQCCGIFVIRIWSLHTYRMLTKCKQDPYLTKWWQPKTKPHVTTDANYICLLSLSRLSDSNYH